MRSLIIGMGEIGTALFNVLSAADYRIDCIQSSRSEKSNFEQPDIMHICFPYSTDFIKQVREYQKKYKPEFTVIHSTVPVGTSRKLKAIHSPIRGIHPHLESGIKTFVKFLAGEEAYLVADYFRRAGMKVVTFEDPETSEAGKLFDTEYYRACIEFGQRVKRYCKKYGLNFHEVYTLFNISYNEGYEKLGHSEFVRPVLDPLLKPIGGHCLVPNSKLIKEGDKKE